jgi:hypothetical protein
MSQQPNDSTFKSLVISKEPNEQDLIFLKRAIELSQLARDNGNHRKKSMNCRCSL